MDLNGFESLVDDDEYTGGSSDTLTNQIRKVDHAAEEGCQSVCTLIKSAQSLLLILRSATSPRLSAQPVAEGQSVTAAPPLSANAVRAARTQFNDALANVRKCISSCKSSRAELSRHIDEAGVDIGDDSDQAILDELRREAAQSNDRLASAISILRSLLTELSVLVDIGDVI